MSVDGFSTMAERSKRAGLIRPAQRLAMRRSMGRRFGALARDRFKIQQLMLEQQRLGNDGTSTTWQQEFDDRRKEMNK